MTLNLSQLPKCKRDCGSCTANRRRVCTGCLNSEAKLDKIFATMAAREHVELRYDGKPMKGKRLFS